MCDCVKLASLLRVLPGSTIFENYQDVLSLGKQQLGQNNWFEEKTILMCVPLVMMGLNSIMQLSLKILVLPCKHPLFFEILINISLALFYLLAECCARGSVS